MLNTESKSVLFCHLSTRRENMNEVHGQVTLNRGQCGYECCKTFLPRGAGTKVYLMNLLQYGCFVIRRVAKLPHQICGQSYKHFTLVNYDSRVVIWGIFKSGTTLES